jgi:hypothetical protein
MSFRTLDQVTPVKNKTTTTTLYLETDDESSYSSTWLLSDMGITDSKDKNGRSVVVTVLAGLSPETAVVGTRLGL